MQLVLQLIPYLSLIVAALCDNRFSAHSFDVTAPPALRAEFVAHDWPTRRPPRTTACPSTTPTPYTAPSEASTTTAAATTSIEASTTTTAYSGCPSIETTSVATTTAAETTTAVATSASASTELAATTTATTTANVITSDDSKPFVSFTINQVSVLQIRTPLSFTYLATGPSSATVKAILRASSSSVFAAVVATNLSLSGSHSGLSAAAEFTPSWLAVGVDYVLELWVVGSTTLASATSPGFQFVTSCAASCGVHGKCNEFTATCSCSSPWFGSTCTSNPCDSLTCENGGICNADSGTCNCTSDYLGSTCNIPNQCDEKSCGLHGTLNPDDCSCSCIAPWSGSQCSSCSLQCEANGGRNDTLCTCICPTDRFGNTCQYAASLQQIELQLSSFSSIRSAQANMHIMSMETDLVPVLEAELLSTVRCATCIEVVQARRASSTNTLVLLYILPSLESLNNSLSSQQSSINATLSALSAAISNPPDTTYLLQYADPSFGLTSVNCPQTGCLSCSYDPLSLAGACLSCNSSTYLYAGSCSSVCPDGFTPSDVSRECVPPGAASQVIPQSAGATTNSSPITNFINSVPTPILLVVGIFLCGVILLGVVACGLWYCFRKRKKSPTKSVSEDSDSTTDSDVILLTPEKSKRIRGHRRVSLPLPRHAAAFVTLTPLPEIHHQQQLL